MNKILLCSENFIKSATNISDNISGKLLTPAIYEAQEFDLRTLLGDILTEKLISLVASGDIELPENEKYKILLDKCQYFLAYNVVKNVCLLTSVKIDNAGLQQVSDEKMEPISIDDSYRIQHFYQMKADNFCYRIQNYLLANKLLYPELTENSLHKIRYNLRSSATTGLWLGGVRNKSRWGDFTRPRPRDRYDNND